MANFNVGDKVRILDVSKIMFGESKWKDGDVAEVTNVFRDGDIRLKINRGEFTGSDFLINTSEFGGIEKVLDKPTKKQRIKALEQDVASLESEVAELKAKVEALEKAQAKPKSVAVTTDNIAVGDKIRVIDAGEITCADLTDGKCYEVTRVADDGEFYVDDDEGDNVYIVSTEFPYVEKLVSE